MMQHIGEVISGEGAHRRSVGHYAFVSVLITLALFLAGEAVATWKGLGTVGRDVYPAATISVSGEGEVFAKPDVATITFTATSETLNVAAAQAAVEASIRDALASLEELGIEERDVRTVSYSVNPRYEYRGAATALFGPDGGTRTLAGYEVKQTVSVRVRDAENAGEVLTRLGGANVSNISGPSFEVEDAEALREEARRKAIAQAKERAERLSDELGVSLGEVVNFYEEPSGGPVPYYAALERGAGGDALPPVSVPPGENEIRARVTLTYEIR